MMRILGVMLNLLGSLIAVVAGIYLLAHSSETGPTWLDVIAHGGGAFFIGCGLYMAGSTFAAADR